MLLKCGHNHYNPNISKFHRDDYQLYIRYKYSIGFKGTKEMCWECYLKMRCSQ